MWKGIKVLGVSLPQLFISPGNCREMCVGTCFFEKCRQMNVFTVNLGWVWINMGVCTWWFLSESNTSLRLPHNLTFSATHSLKRAVWPRSRLNSPFQQIAILTLNLNMRQWSWSHFSQKQHVCSFYSTWCTNARNGTCSSCFNFICGLLSQSKRGRRQYNNGGALV